MKEISEILKILEIEKLAKNTGFTKKCDKKVTATAFLLSFFTIFQNGNYSLRSWAFEIGLKIGDTLSKAGLQKNLTYRHEKLVKAFFMKVLSEETAMPGRFKEVASPLFRDFERVLIEDSTHLNLPSNLASDIKGPNNRNSSKPASTAKIHLQMNLKTDEFLDYNIGSFTDPDGKLTKISETIQENDIVIRDLGYWNMNEFMAINKKGAYYLSKLKRGPVLFDENEDEIDLYELLKKTEKKKVTRLDLKVLLGRRLKLKARLVAIKVPDKQANKKRRKEKNNRDKRLKYTKEKQFLLGWSILITNVPESIWKSEEVRLAYGFRWRIEIIFKCWKSHLKMKKFFEKESLTHPHALIVLHLLLISLSLFFLSNYRKYYAKIFEEYGVRISILKFAAFFIEKFHQLIENDSEPSELLLKNIKCHCCYDKRKDRENHEEKLMLST